MFGPADQLQETGVGVGVAPPSGLTKSMLSTPVVRFWSAGSVVVIARSAAARQATQKTAAIKARRLKNADFELDFFFMVGTGLFPSAAIRDGDQDAR
jgi:hypothetical protein